MKFYKATPVNLRGEKAGNAIAIQNNSFEVEMGAYKPATFLLKHRNQKNNPEREMWETFIFKRNI